MTSMVYEKKLEMGGDGCVLNSLLLPFLLSLLCKLVSNCILGV